MWLLSSLLSSLYSLGCMCREQISSYSVVLLYLIAPFAEQKLFNFVKSHFPLGGLISGVTGILSRALAMHASWAVS